MAMTSEEFRKSAHEMVDWMADYMENVSQFSVKPPVRPGDIKQKLPKTAPLAGDRFDKIFSDFNSVIMPGITHWQHPDFYAYFPSGDSKPSILAEMLSATLGAQCMIWLTSPSAEELEERMMEWLRNMLGMPAAFTGVIQDSSSSSTLVALLTARERLSSFAINQSGFTGGEKYRVYASTQAHSSVDKDVRIAGLGIENLVKVAVGEDFAMLPSELETAIRKDISEGFRPLCIISTLGSTSSTAIDPIEAVGTIARQYNCWHHIDASYAGTALILPEFRWMNKGVELADSFVFNPHKWMFTNFDCSAYFVQDKNALVKTFSILPEYLKTAEDHLVNNYRDWGVPLGRRFRALKLWFVIRSFGVEGLQKKIREHIAIGQWLRDEVEQAVDFELMAPVPLNLVCFRYRPATVNDEILLDKINAELITSLNNSGKMLLTQTRLNNHLVIRLVGGNDNTNFESVKKAWEVIRKVAAGIKVENLVADNSKV